MDKKFIDLKTQLISNGFSEKNYDYLYNAVKSGTKRDLIIKNLTSDIRKVELNQANFALNEMYKLNGGEFKYENKSGYMYSVAYIIIAIVGLLLLISYFSGYEMSIKLLVAGILLFVGFSFKAISTILKTLKGKYREE